MIIIEYSNISKIYNLGKGNIIGVDQTNNTADITCLCFAKLDNGIIAIKRVEYIKKTTRYGQIY